MDKFINDEQKRVNSIGSDPASRQERLAQKEAVRILQVVSCLLKGIKNIEDVENSRFLRGREGESYILRQCTFQGI